MWSHFMCFLRKMPFGRTLVKPSIVLQLLNPFLTSSSIVNFRISSVTNAQPLTYCKKTNHGNDWRQRAEVMWIGPKHVNNVSLRDWSGQDAAQCSSTDLFLWIDKINVQVDSSNLTMKRAARPFSSNLKNDLTQIPTQIIAARERW